MKNILRSLIVLVFCSPSAGIAETRDVERYVSFEEAQLHFAKQANGEAWELLQKDTLSPEEKDLLLYAAFASSYHWHHAGELVHKQRGEWLISRSYSKLKMGPSALYHAKKCLGLTENSPAKLQDFDHAYAYEAMARSYAFIPDFEQASAYYTKAKLAGKQIQNEKDRQLFMADLKSGNWNGLQEYIKD